MTRVGETVVVCGLGHVGYRVARLLLRLGVPVAVLGLEVRPDRARAIGELGGKVERGDARDEAALGLVGIAEAGALVAATNADLANLEVALDARRARADLRLVLRVFDRELARSIEQSLGKARAMGVSALSAPIMAFGALGRDVTSAFSLGDEALLLGNLVVREGSALLGLRPREIRERFSLGVVSANDEPIATGDRITLVGRRDAYLALPHGSRTPPPKAEPGKLPSFGSTLRMAWGNSPKPLRNVFWMLLAVCLISVVVFRFGVDPPISLMEALYYTVTTVTTTGYGDITPRTSGPWMMLYATLFMLLGSVTMAVLYSFATSYVVSEQLRAELGRPPMPKSGHVVVVGLGNVGYRSWDELVRSGYDVVAVDLDADGEFASGLRSRHPFVSGDARLATTLRAAGIEGAVAVIAATGDDATNLAVALGARRLAPEIRTVVRVFDADFATKLEHGRLVDLAVSTSRVAAPTFAASALFDDVAGAFADDRGLTALCFGQTPKDWLGKSPRELGEEVPLVEVSGVISAWDPDEPLPEQSAILFIRRRMFPATPGPAA